MTCNGGCWSAQGSDKIYNLSNEGFKVYLNNYGQRAETGAALLRAGSAKNREWELHYEVKGICNEIPVGSP